MKVFRNRDVPALYVKFEDLTNKEVVGDICKYILNIKSIEGTVIAKRLDDLESMADLQNDLTDPRVLDHFTLD